MDLHNSLLLHNFKIFVCINLIIVEKKKKLRKSAKKVEGEKFVERRKKAESGVKNQLIFHISLDLLPIVDTTLKLFHEG